MVKDCDVLITVLPRVLMVETESVEDLVDDVTHDAQGTDGHGLCTTDEAHIWRTTAMKQLIS